MKKLWILLLIVAFSLAACGEIDPAEIPEIPDVSDISSDSAPIVEMLERIEINDAQTLVLKEVEVSLDLSKRKQVGFDLTLGATKRCDELGTLDNAVYKKIKLHGNQTPCFKNVRFWEPGMIFGQYSPSDSSPDVWFITDANGKIHHLPKAPKKDRGFKNEKKIRKYKGKPVYLTQDDFLAVFDMSSDEEETIIASRVGRYVILPKNNGDHIVYKDLVGMKMLRPDGSILDLSVPGWITDENGVAIGIRGALRPVDDFFKNSSNDIGYTYGGNECRNAIFDASGNMLEAQASGVPVAFQEWLHDPTIGPAGGPKCPLRNIHIPYCERDDDLLLCGTRGFLLADSSQDVREIDWRQLLGVNGSNQIVCLTDNFIFYAAGESLYEINRDLSAFEVILTGFNIYTLQCQGDDNLIIHGLNTANSKYETFQLSGNIRTMIQDNISQFIH